MFTMFTLFIGIYAIAIMLATVYMTARHYSARRRCYRRASLRSLVRGAKRTAIARHYGRA